MAKSTTMDAVVLHGVSDLRFEQVPVPSLVAGSVRVRIGFCGVCGSDLPRCYVKGTYSFPTICGHEFAGVVEALGDGVTQFQVGDRVAVFPLLWRDDHPACEQGKYAQSDGYDYLGSRSDGAFSEYVIAPERNLIRVPDNVSLEEAAMTEPAAVALHAMRRTNFRLGETVAIFGLGPIGLMVAQWVRAMGAAQTILFDILPEKLELARSLGFTHVFDSRSAKPLDITNELTGGRGVHVAIEAAGAPPTMLAAMQVTRRAGRVALLGNPSGDVTIPASLISQVMRREIDLVGTWNSDYSVYGDDDDWRTVLAAMASGTLNLKPLITHRVPLSRGIAALEMMRDQSEFFAKVLIHPDKPQTFMQSVAYYLDKPGGSFTPQQETIAAPGPGEIRLRTAKTSVCQSDVVIYKQGLPRIKHWPALVLHEVCAFVDAIGPSVTKFAPGDLVAIGCDIPCGDVNCIYCGEHGTGDWTSCPNTQATGHEFPGFARSHAILPDWFVKYGPIVKFPAGFNADHACQLEPLACCLEGMTRVNNCIANRIVVLIGAGSQSTYALQCAQAMNARKIILVNRGVERLERVLRDFGDERVVGLRWDENIVASVLRECKPFNEPHFVMINAPCREAYELAPKLMGYGTVLDGHAGVKGAGGKPRIAHEIDLNNDIHYRLQCYQATHGSSMHGIRLAHQFLVEGRLPKIGLMTNPTEKFPHTEIKAAIARAADSDSLKVIIDWN